MQITGDNVSIGISIHALRKESDMHRSQDWPTAENFNPRSP